MEFEQFVASTPGQFVRKVAIDYLKFGYFRYKLLDIPEEKDSSLVDCKLIDSYDITTCRTTRARRKQKGLANVVFVRYRYTFLLMASDGEHPTFNRICSYDFRSVPLHWRGYSVGIYESKPCVRISRNEWQTIKQRFTQIGLDPKEDVERKIINLPYFNFPGVVRQKFQLIAYINTRRRKAGLPLLDAFVPSRF